MKEKDNTKKRILVIGIIFGFMYISIGARAAFLQVYKRDWLMNRAYHLIEKMDVAKGKRGYIYDRNYKALAISSDLESIAADTSYIHDPKNTAHLLARALKTDPKWLYKQLATKRRFVWIERFASPQAVAALKKRKKEKDPLLAGIIFRKEYTRFYPKKTLAAQLLGFAGMDNQGLEGLEKYYDNELKGNTIQVAKYKDNKKGAWLPSRDNRSEIRNGNNIILTIDQFIQYITEQAIEEAVKKFQAKSALAIVMAPESGAILALANYPTFNPNSFNDFSPEYYRNRVVADAFEPGSTMKIFLAAAAIETKMCTAQTLFDCENGKYRILRTTVHDTKEHGVLSLQQIIKYSSNIGAVKISQKIGKYNLYEALHKFGFGQKTHVDCLGETSGLLREPSRWRKINTGTIAYGHGIAVSAIQLITATSSIANGGVLMKPFIVQAITDENGHTIKKNVPKVVRRVVRPETAETVRRIMHSVTTEKGTGQNAAIEGYSVCGKTGTAQKPDKSGKYSKGKYIASFVGFAPEKHPRIAILVVVDEPRKEHYGGTVAAPAFKKIAQKALGYLNVAPDNPKRYNQLTVEKDDGTNS